MPIRVAVNREFVSAEMPLASGDELALIPPVSGGAAPARWRLQHGRGSPRSLSPCGVAKVTGRPEAGAIVTFRGITREMDQLEYEAYREIGTAAVDSGTGLRPWFQGVRRGGDPPLLQAGCEPERICTECFGPTG